MNRIHITDFARWLGQSEAAALLGMTQGAISKAIRIGRNIYVTPHPNGICTAEEVRAFPSQNQRLAS